MLFNSTTINYLIFFCQLLDCVLGFFSGEKESAIRTVIRQKFNNATKTSQVIQKIKLVMIFLNLNYRK